MDKTNYTAISNIRRLMLEQDIPNLGMARAAKMSPNHLRGIMTGDKGLTLYTLDRIAKVLNVQAWELLKG